jgi:hypothetical protein
MRLMIERNQADTAILGWHKGVQFTLWWRLELTAEEVQLVERYKLSNHVLIYRDPDRREPLITLRNAMAGVSETVSSIAIVWKNEQKARECCQNFKSMLDIAKTFGGREIVDL